MKVNENGVELLTRILDARQKEYEQGRYGPWNILLPLSDQETLYSDYWVQSNPTYTFESIPKVLVRERILQVVGVLDCRIGNVSEVTFREPT